MSLHGVESASQSQIQHAAADYIRRGFAVCRLSADTKRPNQVGWPERSAEPGEFTAADEVGIQTGWISNYLVVVDLDDVSARNLADEHLPPTSMVAGHAGNPRAHRYYVIDDAETLGDAVTAPHKAEKSTAAALRRGVALGPPGRQFRHSVSGHTILDFKARGGQVVAPPSRHDKHGARSWAADGEPARIPFATLWDAVRNLARACGWVDESPRSDKRGDAASPAATRDDKPAPWRPSPTANGEPRYGGEITKELDRARLVARACKYSDTLPPAHSGNGGHDRTFAVACVAILDFDLTRDEALSVLRHYNTRCRKGDEWSDAELLHKIDDAAGLERSKNGPRGYQALKLHRPNDPRGVADPSRLAEVFRGDAVFRCWRGQVYRYDGARYKLVNPEELTSEVWRAVDEEFAAIHDRCVRAAQQTYGVACDAASGANTAAPPTPKLPERRSVTQRVCGEVVAALKAYTCVPSEVELNSWLDGRGARDVIAVANGLLDLTDETPRLEPHSPDWFSTTCLPFDYDPAATCPLWEATVAERMSNDPERVEVLRQWFGYLLQRSRNQASRFLVLMGEASSGKSTIVNAMQSLLGEENCTASDLDALFDRFGLADTLGKQLVVCADSGDFDRLQMARLKAFTGGDPMPFERKGKDVFRHLPTAKLVISTNQLARFQDPSNGIWRRVLLVNCDAVIAAADRKPEMLDPAFWHLRGEAPGLLNWAIGGLAALRRGNWKFPDCEAIRNAVEEHRTMSDPVRTFLLERVEEAPGELTDLYPEYKQWCSATGLTQPVGAIVFGRRVRSIYPVAQSVPVRCGRFDGGSSGRKWRGLRLRQFAEPGAVEFIDAPRVILSDETTAAEDRRATDGGVGAPSVAHL